ncbi:MAG: hypothetical protein ACLP53_28475, partial [Isosphaeraceae bacterium]
MVLAALPGMERELLVTGKLAKPGNFSASVNFLGSRIRKVGLVFQIAAIDRRFLDAPVGRISESAMQSIWEALDKLTGRSVAE